MSSKSLGRSLALITAGLVGLFAGLHFITKPFQVFIEDIDEILKRRPSAEQSVIGGVHVIVAPEIEPTILVSVSTPTKSADSKAESVPISVALFDGRKKPSQKATVGSKEWGPPWPLELSRGSTLNGEMLYAGSDPHALTRTFRLGSASHSFSGGFLSEYVIDPPSVEEVRIEEKTVALVITYRGYSDSIPIHVE